MTATDLKVKIKRYLTVLDHKVLFSGVEILTDAVLETMKQINEGSQT